MSDYPRQGSRFVVDLGEVRLPALTEKQVETEIRSVVLAALAEAPEVTAMRFDRSIFGRFPGSTLGLWLDPQGQSPWVPNGPLGPEDHTLVVGQFMAYPFQVLRAVGATPGQQRPTGREIMEAMLDVDEIDQLAKTRLKLMIDGLGQLEPELAKPPRELRKANAMISDLLAGKSISEQIHAFRDAALRPPEPAPDWLREVLAWISHMLEDGASTIYNRDHSFHRTLAPDASGGTRREKDSVDNIKDGDALGAAAGGMAGSLIPALGTATGAACVGGGMSLGVALGELIDWLF